MDADRSRGRDGCDPDHILTLTGRVSRGEGQQLGSELDFPRPAERHGGIGAA